MTQWKSVTIVLLLAALAGYGFYQSAPRGAANPPPAPPPDPAHATGIERLANKPAPAWSVPPNLWVNTTSPIKLSDLKGHITLVEFWRAGCIHCEHAAPFMAQLYRHFHPQGLEMVTFQSPTGPRDELAVESDWSQVKGKVKQWQLPYPVAFDTNGVLFTKVYGGNTYPSVLLLDQKGIVRFAQSGDDAVKERNIAAAIQAHLHPATAGLPAPGGHPRPATSHT